MSTKLKGRDLLCLKDFSKEEILEIITFGDKLKMDSMAGKQEHYLKGKSVAMIFQKASTRTRVSFEVAAFELGAHGLYLNANDMQLRRGETIADTAHVLCRYVAGIVARVFAHQDLIDLAANSDSPIINALSDLSHPCQILGDLMTIREKKGGLKGLRLAYVGDGNNVAHSLLLGCARVGMNIAIASPKGFEPTEEIVKTATEIAKQSGSTILVTNDPIVSVQDADVIYTDVWASMGQEAEHDERVKIMRPFSVNGELLNQAKKDAIVLHCLPAHRGEEITDEVMDGPQSVVFDQAENRLHIQKSVLALLLG
jgi:ornithine carbamoyltransferase